MGQMPDAQTYGESIKYWPYKDSLQFVIECTVSLAPQGGRLLDIMCGTGYVLGKIAERRRDLALTGVDISTEYVEFAKRENSRLDFEVGDVLTWRTPVPFDVVLCTGAVHHVPYELQGAALENISALTRRGGHAIISDCYIDSYRGEVARKLGAAKLGYEYLRTAIRNGAPDEVIQWTVDVLLNDVTKSEFKDSVANRLPMLQRYFAEVETHKMWPGKTSGYGDYVHVCLK